MNVVRTIGRRLTRVGIGLTTVAVVSGAGVASTHVARALNSVELVSVQQSQTQNQQLTLAGDWTETFTVVFGQAQGTTSQLRFTPVAGSGVEYTGTYLGQDANGNVVPVFPQIHFRAWLVRQGQNVLLTIRQIGDNGGYYNTRDAFSSTPTSAFTGESIDTGSGSPLSGNYYQWEMHRTGTTPAATTSQPSQHTRNS